GPGRTSLPYGEQVLDIPDSHVASGSLLAQLAIWRAGRGCPGLNSPYDERGPGRTISPYDERALDGPARHMVLDIPDSHVASGSLLAQLAIWRAGRGCPGLNWKVCVSPFPILSFVSQELFVEEIGSSNSITC
ncbi:LOW QUALITY PROTEIN: hypothetical protein HID58_025061, partial [Brassica napus]